MIVAGRAPWRNSTLAIRLAVAQVIGNPRSAFVERIDGDCHLSYQSYGRQCALFRGSDRDYRTVSEKTRNGAKRHAQSGCSKMTHRQRGEQEMRNGVKVTARTLVMTQPIDWNQLRGKTFRTVSGGGWARINRRGELEGEFISRIGRFTAERVRTKSMRAKKNR